MTARLLLFFSGALVVAMLTAAFATKMIAVGRAQCEAEHMKTALEEEQRAAREMDHLRADVDRAKANARRERKAAEDARNEVHPDDQCRSLPAEWRRLFDSTDGGQTGSAAGGSDGASAGLAGNDGSGASPARAGGGGGR